VVRPIKERQVEGLPDASYFKPAGIPVRLLEESVMTIEEAEALRLSDYDKLSQIDAAEKMKVSRATYQRILGNAHFKVADALFNGKAIRINGGNYGIRSGFNPENILEGENKEMKFAIPVYEGRLNPHFGQSREFAFIDAEPGKIIKHEVVNPIASGCGSLPALLMSNHIQVVLVGGIGVPPRQILENNGIKVIAGVTEADPEKAVLAYLAGTLVAGQSTCHEGPDHAAGHGCCHGDDHHEENHQHCCH
jgi:predicted DNA-binding protein (UPF0251 family)/predicted Fe-Mo cluster-binding NifX family protein